MIITNITNPKQTVLVTCRNKDQDNIITLDWHMPLSIKPPMYAISLGHRRHSLEIIRKSGVFVVNFVTPEQEEDVWYCGSHSGRKVNKFQETSLEKEESETIDCPRIKQAVGYLECEVKEEKEIGDHVLFIANVKKERLKGRQKRLFHVSGKQFTTTR